MCEVPINEEVVIGDITWNQSNKIIDEKDDEGSSSIGQHNLKLSTNFLNSHQSRGKIYSLEAYNTNSGQYRMPGGGEGCSSTYNQHLKSLLNNERDSSATSNNFVNRAPDTTIQNNIFTQFTRPIENINRGDHQIDAVLQSIARLECFLSYLSDKIKSNTLKISNVDVVPSPPFAPLLQQSGATAAAGACCLSQTTASRSDLSIDEMNLRRFKDYMLLSDR